MRYGFFGLAIAGLIAAATYIGGQSTTPSVSTLIADLYAAGDAEGIVERLAPGTVGAEQLENFRFGVEQELGSGAQIVSTDQVTAQGATFTRSESSSGIQWCVGPGDSVYILCRIGAAAVTGAVEGAPLEVAAANAEIFVDASAISVILITDDPEGYTLDGELELVGSDGSPVDATMTESLFISGGQPFPADPADLQLPPGVGLLLSFEGSPEPGTLTGRSLTLRWANGEVALEVSEPELFLG